MNPPQDAPILGDEILLRRIPPSSAGNVTISERPDGGCRATSWAMKTKPSEDALSCSRLKLTSPNQLLDMLLSQGKDSSEWHVCEFKVSDVLELGLEIAFTPTEIDPGHCSITAQNGSPYPNGTKAQKLAKRTRILTQEEIDNLSQH